MIEISTPIQAQISLESMQEKPPDISVFGKNPNKKNKLGVFAKLLEGLTVKPKGKTTEISGSGGINGNLAKDKLINGKEEALAGLAPLTTFS